MADGLWLCLYPPAAFAIFLLAKARVSRVRFGLLLDAGIGALAVGALYAHLVVDKLVIDGGAVSPLGFATVLAYPTGDFIIAAAGIALLAATGWRPSRDVALVTLAFGVYAVADGAYLVQVADGSYIPGGLSDSGFMVAAIVCGAAAVFSVGARAGSSARGKRTRRVLVPVVFGLLALLLLVIEATGGAAIAVIVPATMTMMLVVTRMGLNHFRAERLLRTSRHEASTDALTGLANRRSLLRALGRAEASGRPSLLSLFDLDGFKYYNDTYGHPAGDDLLRRIARALERESGPDVKVYRLGGDEFCLLGPSEGLDVHRELARIAGAVAQRGEGFQVTASFGAVLLPTETPEASEALRIADRRMYEAKTYGRSSAQRQSADVLVAVLQERSPDLHQHGANVSNLAVGVGRELGLVNGDIEQLREAAVLHDVGKLAIPEEILEKQGPLDEEEWSFMRRHTMIGERIVGAAPALTAAARFIRSNHERWDGGGYPDGIAGEEIPLASRVLFVCDAFDAMTTKRVYSEPRSSSVALEELRACAGTQFDPRVVEALAIVLSRRAASAPSAPGAPGAASTPSAPVALPAAA